MGTNMSGTFEYLQDIVLETDAVGDFLTELAKFSADALSGTDEVLCGITLLRRKNAHTVASSSERAQKMDEIQYGYPDGPCVAAAREGVTIHVPDLRAEQRWPEYSAAVLEHGARSILSVALELDCESRAALNVYSAEPGKFDPDSIRRTESFASRASKALRLALRIAEHSETVSHLQAALESRTTINIAVGIVMSQNRCSQEEAFEVLRAASSNRNVKLREVAASIVASLGPAEPLSTHFEH